MEPADSAMTGREVREMRCCSLLVLVCEEARYFLSTYLALMNVEMVLRKEGARLAGRAEGRGTRTTHVLSTVRLPGLRASQ